jgi:hypothetical protein
MKKEAMLGAGLAASTVKKRLLIISGAIMLAIGIIGSISFGSIVINEAAQQQLNPTTQRPNNIYGVISPLYAEIAFMTIGVVGFSRLVLGATLPKKSKQQQRH